MLMSLWSCGGQRCHGNIFHAASPESLMFVGKVSSELKNSDEEMKNKQLISLKKILTSCLVPHRRRSKVTELLFSIVFNIFG